MRRIVAGLAWTLSFAWAGNYVAMLTGVPAIVTAVGAVAVGVFVAADPLRRIWTTEVARQPVATMPSNPTVERIPQA